MKILLHCDFDQQTIADHFGLSEYSYWFVFETYHAVLKEILDTQVISDPAQADSIWEVCDAEGVPCVLLSFNPPHKTPVHLRCPVIPVFAWEFPGLPRAADEKIWADDPRHDWEYVLRRVMAALTLSTHTQRAVTSRLGADYPIQAVPTPLWDRLDRIRQDMTWRAFGMSRTIRLNASVVDINTLGLSLEGYLAPGAIVDDTPHDDTDERLLPPHFTAPSGTQAQFASRDQKQPLLLEPDEFEPASAGWEIPPSRTYKTRLEGVVYTSVFTASDERKNWPDLLTAFIYAFRESEDVVLILKMGGAELIWQHHKLIDLLTRLSPFKCRVLVVYGYMSADDYQQLIAATDFYVNASLCEGLCMPLMEYLSSGVPAIAPAHTAMADYISSDNSFVVKSSDGYPAIWPHGDRLVNHTTRSQINWHSLMECYRESYELIRKSRQEYARMSALAVRSMRRYCSDESVKSDLRRFFANLEPGRDSQAAAAPTRPTSGYQQ